MNLGWIVLMRGVISFITLLILVNILGKQQVGQLTFFDFITGITIGSLAGTLTVDFDTRAWPHFVGMLVWTGMALGAQYLSLKSRWWGKIVGSQPAILIQNGHILEKNMAKNRYRYDDLLTQLREKDVFDLAEVEVALLETNGSLSVLKRSQDLPVTPKDLKLPTQYKGLATELIYEGKVITANLEGVHLSRAWLQQELAKKGITDFAEVTLAVLSTDGTLFVDTYQDRIDPLEVDDQRQIH